MSNILLPDFRADTRTIVEAIRQLVYKDSDFTVTAGTSSVVTDVNAGPDSTILLTQTGGTLLKAAVTTKGDGQFTVTHDTAAGTETFDYLVIN